MTNYRGACHCGTVTFEAEMDPDHATECNCSICRRKGALYHGASVAGFRILTGEGELILY